MSRRLAACLLIVSAAAVTSGCAGREPPHRPAREIAPDTVSLGERWEFGPCGTIVVTLESGERVEITQEGIGQGAGCPPPQPTPFLIGRASDLTQDAEAGEPWRAADAPLVFIADVDGQIQLGAVRRDGGCWRHQFREKEGAFDMGKTFLLASGLVLEVADNLQRPIETYDPFPLRIQDEICLDKSGRLISIQLFHEY